MSETLPFFVSLMTALFMGGTAIAAVWFGGMISKSKPKER